MVTSITSAVISQRAWLITAAFGSPVVPDVKIYTAACSATSPSRQRAGGLAGSAPCAAALRSSVHNARSAASAGCSGSAHNQ